MPRICKTSRLFSNIKIRLEQLLNLDAANFTLFVKLADYFVAYIKIRN
jgi:hypothetical protein